MSDSDAEKLMKYISNPNPENMLVYIGKSGIGKTYFCSALEEWAFKNFDTDRYWKESALLQELRESMNEGKQDYRKKLMCCIDDQLIILDDVGSGINPQHITKKDYEWRIEVLYEFLEERFSSGLPTVITSNLSEEEFFKIYSSRIHSRLFAARNTIIKDFVGEDKRLIKIGNGNEK